MRIAFRKVRPIILGINHYLDELGHNLQEVIEMLFEDGEPAFESEFVGTQMVAMV